MLSFFFVFAAALLFGKISSTKLYFSLFVETSLPSEAESKKIAFNYLGGRINFAKSFASFDPGNEFILVLKDFSYNAEESSSNVVLLQKIGAIYNEIPSRLTDSSDNGFLIDSSFGIVDVNRNGNKFIYYIRTMRGNMAGTDTLYLPNTVSPFEEYTVSRVYDSNYQNSPTRFNYDFSENPNEKIEDIKRAAREVGFIEKTPAVASPVVEGGTF